MDSGGYFLDITILMRLIILHHDYTDLRDKDAYFIYSLIPHWQRRGIEVKHWTGTRDLPEGDAVLVHVDLSVVPSRFLKAALRYPLAFNSRMEDIRKSALPGRNLCLAASSAFLGAVVVKTELNHGGIPEKLFFQKRRLSLPLVESWDLFRASRLVEPLTYPVYGSAAEVPGNIWKDPRYVVEKFLPEMEGNNYVLRYAYFLGKARIGYRILGKNPILRWAGKVAEELSPIPPEVSAFREKIGLDYGKIDFVVHQGGAVILDVNKTIGGPAASLVEEPLAAALAEGLPF